MRSDTWSVEYFESLSDQPIIAINEGGAVSYAVNVYYGVSRENGRMITRTFTYEKGAYDDAIAGGMNPSLYVASPNKI